MKKATPSPQKSKAVQAEEHIDALIALGWDMNKQDLLEWKLSLSDDEPKIKSLKVKNYN